MLAAVVGVAVAPPGLRVGNSDSQAVTTSPISDAKVALRVR